MDRFIQQCENEQLHRSGAILPHGTLLVADKNSIIVNLAGNFSTFSGMHSVETGQPVSAPLREFLDIADQAGTRITRQIEIGDALFDVVATRNEDGHVVIELTKGESLPEGGMRLPISLPEDEASQPDFLCKEIRNITGFERVLYYRFREDGDGEVKAESCVNPEMGSYLGLRFPASDIPRIARNLLLKNPWRFIPDAQADPVAISGDTLPDLTYSDLRSVSPVHRIYLANMGVSAALSFPIVTGNSLNATISCHHSSPMTLPLACLQRAADIVRIHARSLTAFQATRRLKFLDSLGRRMAEAGSILEKHEGDVLRAWDELGKLLCSEFAADGVMICMEGGIAFHGEVFEHDALDAMEHWMASNGQDFIWEIENLSKHVPGFPLSRIAGVLATRVASAHLYICRTEHLHEVAWGGNPDKPVEYHDGKIGISPRRSFEKWIEKRFGYCRPWTNESRLLLLKLRELFLHA